MKQLITLLLGLILISCGNTKTSSTTTKAKNHALPESVFGEWFDPTGNREYNGVLIHPNFIEFQYTAFMYNRITKKEDNLYEFIGKNNDGQIVSFQLQIINKNTITLRSGHLRNTTYIKKELPPAAEQVSIKEVPRQIKNSWYTTDGGNFLEFKISNKQFWFKDEEYHIDEIMHIQEPKYNLDQYRFVVSRGKKSWLFYFKHWSDDNIQIGYNFKKGAIYKSNKDYAVSSVSLPKTLFDEWYNPSGNWEYNGVLIQPGFIEYNYTAFMFDEIDKLNDTDYRFSARTNNRSLTGIVSILNENTINLKRGNEQIATYIKGKYPYASTPVSMADVPAQIKGSWHLMRVSDDIEFAITDTQFKYKGQEYKVDEIRYIDDPKIEQYRFIVSNGKKTHMFYFKHWGNGRIQIGFNGRKGRAYAKD